MRMPLLTTISEDSLLAPLIRMGTPPSYKLLTAALMVGVPTVLFYLLPKKKHITPYYLNKSTCLWGITIGIRLERRVSGSAAAEEVIGNDDLLTQILVLLPAKTVVRFKCVSKQWSSLISSEFFTRRHVGRVDSRQPSFIMTDVHGFPELFICHHTKKKLVRVSIPSPIKNPLCKYNILQSWNGLLLISMKFLREDRIDHVVFNPTTKQYRLFQQLDGYRPITICFLCDPSKPEYYKLLMITSITPYIYSVYDLATQEWSHNMQGVDPFKVDLGFRISTALILNIIVSSIKNFQYHLYPLYPPELVHFPEGSAYDNYIFESVEYINLGQVKIFPGENMLEFRVGVWDKNRRIWVIRHTDTLGFKNSSAGVRMLGMMREKGAAIQDAVFLFHIQGQLLIYKINQGMKVLVDYRRERFYVKDEWLFEHVHSFIHTFAVV